MKIKNGFTLMELLVVVAIIAVVGVSSVISFASIKDDTAEKDLQNKYLDIIRAANLYVDLDDDSQEWLIGTGHVDIPLEILRSQNYISTDLGNPVTGEDINLRYSVRICITKDRFNNDLVDSCIIDIPSAGNVTYIADRYGISDPNKLNHCCE